MTLRLLICLAMLSFYATFARADDIDPRDPSSVSDTMQRFGYRAELKKDDTGDPMVSSSAGGYKFVVFFYGCTDGADCNSIQFQSSFTSDDEVEASVLNDWNKNFRFTKAYFDDDNDPTIVMDLTMGEGGISEDIFKDAITLWEARLATFAGKIGF